MRGGLIGAGVGFNFWQSGPWVAGVAGDLSWADISGSSGACGAGSPLPHSCGTRLQSLGTVRGTIGYAPGPYWLVYGTAGYAGGDIHAWDALAGGAGTSLLSGWTAGAGIEALIAQNWSVKFEYLHVDLGHAAVFDIVQGVSETVSFTGDIFPCRPQSETQCAAGTDIRKADVHEVALKPRPERSFARGFRAHKVRRRSCLLCLAMAHVARPSNVL
jgi:Outer membrane protein beta-barrel domain